MSSQHQQVEERSLAPGADARKDLLGGLPVTERRMELAGVSTAVLEGGDGPPMVLLHGPGEFALGWMRVLPDLVTSHRVVVPDLPDHGSSTVTDGSLGSEGVLAWLGELVDATCSSPPVVVARSGSGAIAARFASARGSKVERLVLVDMLGLGEFHPTARFELAMTRFLTQPDEKSFDRLAIECFFDADGVRDQFGERWSAFEAYSIDRASTPSVQAAVGTLLSEFGIAPIPPPELEQIAVPTALIWGRYDLATDLEIAQTASARFGWPLVVIDDAGEDPAIEQPEAFLAALRDILS